MQGSVQDHRPCQHEEEGGREKHATRGVDPHQRHQRRRQEIHDEVRDHGPVDFVELRERGALSEFRKGEHSGEVVRVILERRDQGVEKGKDKDCAREERLSHHNTKTLRPEVDILKWAGDAAEGRKSHSRSLGSLGRGQ